MIGTFGRPWGEDAPAPAVRPGVQAIVSLLPVAAEALASLQDVRRQVETLQVKEAWARSHGLTLMADLYKAKLAAAQQKLALTQESEERSRSWSMLGRTGASVGIAGGIAFAVLVLALAFAVRRR